MSESFNSIKRKGRVREVLRNWPESNAWLITGDVAHLLRRGRYEPQYVDGKEAMRRVKSEVKSMND